MKKLIEYRIETPSSLRKVYDIWKRYLYNDPLWHFTLEGSYIEIRLSKRNRNIEGYLKAKKWPYLSFPYMDNIPSTRKYQESFQIIFHGYSELIMKIIHKHLTKKREDTERDKSIERIVHLGFNLLGYDNEKESAWLMNYILNRSWHTGYYHRIIEEQEEKKQNIKKEEHGKK